MKNLIPKNIFLLMLVFVVAISCDREQSGKYEMTDGLPTVKYVRYQSKYKEEMLLDGAYMN